MMKTVNKPLNIRTGLPATEAPSPAFLTPGATVQVSEIVRGTMIDGNNKWYKGVDGNFYWSGGFDNTVSDSALIITQDDPATRLINYNDLLEGVDSTLKSGRGEGIHIAILDSGLNAGHQDLQSLKIITRQNCTGNNTADTTDHTEEGHGSHVTGLIAASGKEKGITGLSSLAGVSVYKVIADDDTVSGTSLDAALQHILSSSNPPDIINMSLSITQDEYTAILPTLDAISKKCICIAAAGNNNTLLASKKRLFVPALHKDIIAVGAIDSSFISSNPTPVFHPQLDFVLPSFSFFSCSNTGAGGYKRLKGASMTTAFVTAFAALLLKKDPSLKGNATAMKIQLGKIAKPYGPGLLNSFQLTKPTS
jgi:subtilisin family serine protease